MGVLPSGTVTFLFTDIQGSTRLWEEHPSAMQRALARHDEILSRTIAAHGGRVVKTTGDGVHAVFETAVAGALAALDAQLALVTEPWDVSAPLRVRMGLHTGTAELRDSDYYGSALNRAARIMSAAHGGQVVVSEVTEQLVRDGLPADVVVVSLGEHQLRDLAAPMQVFQLSRPGLPTDFPPLVSLNAYEGNLPVQRTSFVGRARELDRVGSLLQERRLLTLTGVGGVGKTRLALQVASDAPARFAGGTWLIELARTGLPAAVPSVAATALGAVPQAGLTDTEVVCDHLRTARAILVLDNCEHVLDAAAEFTEAVLDRCPGVVVVATSREPLDVAGEQVVPVRPLDHATDAIALFVERARGADPEFDLGADSQASVEEICRRLDGVPLAVELAAAHVDTMDVTEIAARLDDRFRLLASGRRRSVDRHHTMRAALEWSHQLLDRDERLLLRRLGVFAGGFPADAVAAVCTTGNDSFDVDEVLGSLVRKSLVQFEREPRPGRYRLLETVRAFALEQLAAADESLVLGRAHAEWVATLVDHPIDEWYVQGAVDYAAVRREVDNWRDAVDYALSMPDPQLAVRLAFHTLGADVPETARWTEAVLALDGVADLPDTHWLHWVLLTRAAAEMDVDAVGGHIAAFKGGASDTSEHAWVGAFEAMLAFSEGRDPLPVLDHHIGTAGLTPLAIADLHLYRCFFANMPPRSDPDAARLAVRLGREARHVALPVAMTTLAASLQHDDPAGSMAVLREAEKLAEESGNRFIIASVASFGALALLALPDDVLARELLVRLDQLQPHWTNAAAALLTVCICMLRRVGDPASTRLQALVWSAPGAVTTARMVAPDLPDPDDVLSEPASFDDAVELARASLRKIAAYG
jgi:predicted ATPase/class 3 adenylate cyclase